MIELIQKKLEEVRSNGKKLYLTRQELQMRLQQTQLSIAQVEAEMLKSDGEERVLESLLGKKNE